MPAVVEEILGAVGDGRKITVYGDFDVDGVAATTIMVTVLRQLGADCDWFIPDRISEGYGLSSEAIKELAARGTGLVVTVDCGITSVEEVKLAKELGLAVVVTDHHRSDGTLPDCPILHPVVSGYPFTELCGAAVAAKLATALRRAGGLDPSLDEADLDLVALATVADVMPLRGENRRLVREGVKVARRAQRPGMKALIADAGMQPAQLSSEDLGFRLGPRINAAGRIYRADAGVELFLADSPERAGEIASELGRANNERRRIEREVETAAEAARRELGGTPSAALVVAGEGWHPGVVGIVASRMVRKHGVPAVVISIDGETARGSARGVPGLDLHEAISSTASLLEGFGGHAAAAGLQIRPGKIAEFREALSLAVVAQIGEDPAAVPERIDAVAGGQELALELAEELGRLEPCGKDNPSPSLLIPSARITDLREMGEGKHCRFSVVSGRARAAGVSFGRTGFDVEEHEPVDVLAELSVNHWNGSSQAQLRVIDVVPVPDPEGAGLDLPGCGPGEWWSRFERSLSGPALPEADPDGTGFQDQSNSFRLGGPAEIVLADLISSGESLLVLTADARRRWRSLGGPGLGRLRGGGPESVKGLWSGSPAEAVQDFSAGLTTGVGMTDHRTLAAYPGLAGVAQTTVVFDPAANPSEAALAVSGESTVVLADPAVFEFAELASADRHALTARLRLLFKALRDAGTVSGEDLRQILSGAPSEGVPGTAWAPEDSAILLGVLVEAGLARTGGEAHARTVGIVSSGKVDLAASALFSEQARIHKEQIEFLRQSNR
jgi:single-stranded-DNA-specific exonuclease